jgi:hypothetical protein
MTKLGSNHRDSLFESIPSQSLAVRISESPLTAAAIAGATMGCGYQLLAHDRTDPKFFSGLLQRSIGGAVFVIGVYALAPEFLRGMAL